jgi:hypothetical protein
MLRERAQDEQAQKDKAEQQAREPISHLKGHGEDRQ